MINYNRLGYEIKRDLANFSEKKGFFCMSNKTRYKKGFYRFLFSRCSSK